MSGCGRKKCPSHNGNISRRALLERIKSDFNQLTKGGPKNLVEQTREFLPD